MLKESTATGLFAKRPISTAALAIIIAGLGFIFVGGLVPPTPNYRYLPGHEWIMATVCWGFSLFLAYSSYLGFRGKSRW